MSSRHGMKSKKRSSNTSKHIVYSPSSTTSSTRQFPETAHDGESSPASSSARSKLHSSYSENTLFDVERTKENVTVTVRFRPLSPREIRQGDEISSYADGETIVRNEHSPSLAYAYDRVFGPTTTTRQIYDIAAQHVVSGAMEGINGTIFAYGVTSSGKTHTMHGDQRSPGIIPLAVKDVFSIIQETPSREFLLRVSYLEIYNEVVNDLLNPSGQNLRIREDAQGTFVEGIKEEVVLSPAHALSLIAAGEEHRHVGSTHFNLLSSRSHTIFTLTVESSPCGDICHNEAVNFSQLNLIDLAGSESSRAKTTGTRQREGSYINKSLLTLGTVISKLTDGKATHIPYRDSKLTRLLQYSLGGHGRVSLICTVTPSSMNSEETHNTLKFARRAKHIEIQAAQNKIIDEKSLIKKYQNEIRCLKEELEQLKKGIITVEQMKEMSDDDLMLLKQKLEDGQYKLQSRLEQEEEAKAALLGRIQRLTKLILVSSKVSESKRYSICPGPRRRHSFGEEELAYLPHRRRDISIDDENINFFASPEDNPANLDCTFNEDKKSRKNGLLNWLKPRKRDSGSVAQIIITDKSTVVKSTPSTPRAKDTGFYTQSRFSNLPVESSLLENISHEGGQDREFSVECRLKQETPQTSANTMCTVDLLWEQKKTLSEEVARQKQNLKLLTEEATEQPVNERIHVKMEKLSEEIKVKNEQISLLEKEIADFIIFGEDRKNKLDVSQTMDELVLQLNEKTFELEVKTADNRIMQEQLNEKTRECEELRESVESLKQKLSDALESNMFNSDVPQPKCYCGVNTADNDFIVQVSQVEHLTQRVAELTNSKEQVELRNLKLAEESSYAKGLASAAAVELKALSEEVSKLMAHNERLASEIVTLKKSPTTHRRASLPVQNGRKDNSSIKRREIGGTPSDMRRELALLRERELSFEAAMLEKDEREAELRREVEDCRQRESDLENEIANMWILVGKLKSHKADYGSVLSASDAKVTGSLDSIDDWSVPSGMNRFQ